MSAGLRFGVAAFALSLGACAYGEKSFDKFSAKHPGADLLPVEFVKQKEAADCGAAALTSVGRFWGTDVAPGSILKEWSPANRAFGYSIAELHGVSDRLGLASSRLLEQPDYIFDLVEDGVPVIAPISKPYQRQDVFDFMVSSMLARVVVSAFIESPTVNHYVVVLGSDDQLVYVLDPQDGYRVVPRGEFVEQWSDLTLKFLPDAGESVAAFAPYRAAAEISAFDEPAASAAAPGATEDIAAHDAAMGLTAEGAGITRAP